VTVSPRQRKVKPNGKKRMNLHASPQARAVVREPDANRGNPDLDGDPALLLPSGLLPGMSACDS